MSERGFARLPLLPRVDYVHRSVFLDQAPNRYLRKHWRESSVYLPVHRRQRRSGRIDREFLNKVVLEALTRDLIKRAP